MRPRASKVRSLSPKPAKIRAWWNGFGEERLQVSQPPRGGRPAHRRSRDSPDRTRRDAPIEGCFEIWIASPVLPWPNRARPRH